jgi:glutathione S-transferase
MAAPAAARGHGAVTGLWISLPRARLGLGRARAYVGSIEEPHMSEPVEIFFWPTPNGVKITIACEEMGLPYKITPVNIGKGDQFKPDFLKISPNTRMPAITDPEGPDGKPISIFESGAILQYLGRKSGKCYGPSERERIGADQWVHWQVANLGPVSGQYNHFRNYARTLGGDPDQLKYAVDRFGNELNKLHGVMETVLAERDYIATGAFSIADIACWGWMRGAAAREEWAKEFPRTKAWFDRVAGRPGVQRGVDAGKVVRQTPPEQMTPEEQAQRQKMLFGQTAKSVADAASAAKS